MVRSVCLMLVGVAAVDEEFYHTQLLQTKVAVDEHKSKTKALQTANSLTNLFTFKGDHEEFEGHCSFLYGMDDTQAVGKCVGCMKGHGMDEDKAKKMEDLCETDPRGCVAEGVALLSDCVGKPDIFTSECTEVGHGGGDLLACFSCSAMLEVSPKQAVRSEAAFGFMQCVTMINDAMDSMGGGGGGGGSSSSSLDFVKRKFHAAQPASSSSGFDACSLWPEASPDDCKKADEAAVEAAFEALMKCEEADPMECFFKEYIEVMTDELGEDIVTKECKALIGDDVDMELCYATGEECGCGIPISDDCKTCVGDSYPESLLLVQKSLKSKKRATALGAVQAKGKLTAAVMVKARK